MRRLKGGKEKKKLQKAESKDGIIDRQERKNKKANIKAEQVIKINYIRIESKNERKRRIEKWKY